MPKRVSIYNRTFTVAGGEGDNYYQQIPAGGDLTDPVLAALRPHVGPDSVCLDVGANIGLYSLGLSVLAPRGHVYAFEPSPSAFGPLRQNLAANQVTNVTPLGLAVGESTGTVSFHDFWFFSAGSFAADEDSLLTAESYGSEATEVGCTTIDDFVAEHGLDRVDFVKVDVEGAELAVLAGAEKTLATHRPTTVLEFNTFGFTIHRSVLPQVALARIREVFPYIFVLDRADGGLLRLETPKEMYEFLYDNGIHGPSDNLLCSFEDLPVDRRYTHFWLRDGHRPGHPEALSEAEAMRRTVSWRVTAPLRRVRTFLDPVVGRARSLRERSGDRPPVDDPHTREVG